ncbi:MAG TPA: MauE/DoxX family redox-associated membrane protein [bacterium]|nr:MauE/DoxX family redox-associated membrane protein [bacterium]
MNALLKNEWLSLVFRLIVGAVFVYAALDKIMHPDGFAKAVSNYRILPGSLINLVALFLPWLELLTGAALILGTKVEGASFLISGMLVIFLIAVTATLIRGISIDCGCFTTSSAGRKAGWGLLVQDTLLLLLSLHLLARGPGRFALEAKRA